jgi:hypothetical protein
MSRVKIRVSKVVNTKQKTSAAGTVGDAELDRARGNLVSTPEDDEREKSAHRGNR